MTSGLSGERLNTSSEPHYNSFAQRSWLYSDDPALLIRMEGRPRSASKEVLSLRLPAEEEDIQQETRKEQGQVVLEQALRTSSTASRMVESQRAEERQRTMTAPAHYGRRYVYTGDVISKTGSRRYGVFLDEHDEDVVKEYTQHMKRR